MEQWSDEVELYPETQRFGNRAFRQYIALVEEVSICIELFTNLTDLMLAQRLPTLLPTPPEITSHLLPLLLQSHAFGHPVRLDYGSGHELSFVLSLFVMVQMGYIGHLRKDDGATGDGEAEEDDLVLRVFPRYACPVTVIQIAFSFYPHLVLRRSYLALVTGLQKKYRLEPAGSHGVWGLDDFCFLPYLWGSAQLLGEFSLPFPVECPGSG